MGVMSTFLRVPFGGFSIFSFLGMDKCEQFRFASSSVNELSFPHSFSDCCPKHNRLQPFNGELACCDVPHAVVGRTVFCVSIEKPFVRLVLTFILHSVFIKRMPNQLRNSVKN